MRVALAESSIPSPREASCVVLSHCANERQASTFPSTAGRVDLGGSLVLGRCACKMCLRTLTQNDLTKHTAKQSSKYVG